MPADRRPPRNWFEAGGDAYARFRPEYPPALAAWLAGIEPSRELAVDVGFEAAGRSLLFRVACRDEAGPIGEGLHRRVIIDLERFMSRLEAKAASRG